MDSIALIYVTFPDEDFAKKIGKTLLQSGLIACINYFPIQSMYTWNGKIEEGQEVIGIMKTNLSKVVSCREIITSIHPYEVPCILSTKWESNESYWSWINEVTTHKQENIDKKFPE